MIGSLVVLLPSDHKGGSIQVQHHDEKVSFRGSREKLTLIAFCADCRHEVRPVKEGYRVVLTYNLRAERGTAGISFSPAADVIEPLTRAVGEYFETPPPTLGRDQPYRVFVYLLDHRNTGAIDPEGRAKASRPARRLRPAVVPRPAGHLGVRGRVRHIDAAAGLARRPPRSLPGPLRTGLRGRKEAGGLAGGRAVALVDGPMERGLRISPTPGPPLLLTSVAR